MNFDIKTEQLSDDTYVISLAGEVDLYTAPEFKQQLLEVIGQGGKEVVVDFSEHDVHRLDDARRPRRRRQAAALERRPALARLQRPEHHEDLRDHGPRPGLHDLPDARRGGREARERRQRALRRSARPTLFGALALGALVASAAGCGTGGKAPSHARPGERRRSSSRRECAGCHVLAAAGLAGDDRPEPRRRVRGRSRKQGFKQSTIQNVVLDQIREPSPPMPKNLVTGPGRAGRRRLRRRRRRTGRAPRSRPPQLGNDGKAIFQANCASCHTLKAAGATGTIGPEPRPAEAVASAIVKHQVEVGGGVMPAFKGKLTAAQIDAVAKFVAASAGK